MEEENHEDVPKAFEIKATFALSSKMAFPYPHFMA